MRSYLNASLFMALTLSLILVFSGCSGGEVTLNGRGASFPNQLYSLWFHEFHNEHRVRINYAPDGSGAGITSIIDGTVNFGASDALMTTEQLDRAFAKNGEILTIPLIAGAVAVVYNLPGIVTGELNLSGQVIADIYLGKISKWNDVAIASLNPGLVLPDKDITVVCRADSSGTTNIFTNYLSKASSEFSERIGTKKMPNWPLANKLGGAGNAGVAKMVKEEAYRIGYVELAYAVSEKIPVAKVMNSSGKFIMPSTYSASVATEGVALPDDMRIMITNSSEPEAYPIVGYTWIIVYANQKNELKGKALVDFLWWAAHDGQNYCEELYYVKLSPSALEKVEALIKSIKYKGEPIYQDNR